MYEGFNFNKREFIFLEETDSTNNELKALIRSSEKPLFTVISAKKQLSGRGRLGRSFFSPEGGLYFSLSLPLTGKENNIPFITLLAGLCVYKAIKELTGISTEVKWPNDIYLNDKKLCGILSELVSGKQLTAVVGIGININVKKTDIPPELSDIMTSFAAEGLIPPDEKELTEKITQYIDEFIYEREELFAVHDDTVSAVKSISCSIGRKVKYILGDSVSEGVITDILKTGAAEITLPDNTVKEIFCGEITR